MRRAGETIKTILITSLVTVILIALIGFILLLKVDFPFKKLLKVIAIVETKYVGEYDREASEKSAIDAVITSLGDKYSNYYDEDNVDDAIQLIEGKYVGIGVVISSDFQKGRVEVESVYEDSPAHNAGIKSGDLITFIDKKEFFDKDIEEMSDYLKWDGKSESLEKKFEIVLDRNGESFTVNLERAEVNIYKVKSLMIDDICYIKYSGFTPTSYNEFSKIINGLDDSVKGIVVDIRNNPGGEFNSVINSCDLFLEDETIMYTVDKKGKKDYITAKKGGTDKPLAVLINRSSASASEIFAGAIKANKRGVIVGEKTYGKGVSQSFIGIEHSSFEEGVVKVTTLKNYTPDGKFINEGIEPDIEIPYPEINDDITKDQAFLAAVKSLKEEK